MGLLVIEMMFKVVKADFGRKVIIPINPREPLTRCSRRFPQLNEKHSRCSNALKWQFSVVSSCDKNKTRHKSIVVSNNAILDIQYFIVPYFSILWEMPRRKTQEF